MALGLKGSWKKTKGYRFRHRLKELKWDIKYAWQRAWRGWDSRDIFNMNTCFIERQKEILKNYRKNHWGLFNVPAEYKDAFKEYHFNEEETDMIIDIMIYHLELMNDDNVEKLLYGNNIYDDDYDPGEYGKRYKRISIVVDQNKEAFMKLFNLFFWQLWD